MTICATKRRPARPLALALIALVAALATGSTAERAEAGTACTKYGEVRAEKLRNRQARASIRCFLNRERENRGIKRLDNDRRLQRASQRHTEAMMNKRCFSHQCPGEGSLEARLRSVDYLLGSLLRFTFGENIAFGGAHYGTPKSIVKAWMKSPPHRANILNGAFRDVGVGFAPGTPGSPKASGGTYTTDFGLRILG